MKKHFPKGHPAPDFGRRRASAHPLVWAIGAAGLGVAALWLRHRGVKRVASAARSQHSAGRVDEEKKVHARAAELTQLARHLIRVAEDEKSELARELHDTFGSNLTAINMDLNWIAKRLPAERSELQTRLQRALGMLSATVTSTQEAIDRLRPSQLDNLGLTVALRTHCQDLAERAGFACQMQAVEDFESLDRERSIALYRVAQDALASVEMYSRSANVEVELMREIDGIRLRIWNDSVDLTRARDARAHVIGMRERVESLGGSLAVSAVKGRGGTQVDAFIPTLEVGESTT